MILSKFVKKLIKFFIFSLITNSNIFYLKKSKQIIFSQARSRYSGNSKYLFEYLAENGYRVYWLYTDDIQKDKIPIKYNEHLIYRKSFKGFIHAIKSQFFVITHGSSDLGLLWHIAKHNTVLNLWHGICIKNIALVDVKFKEIDNKYIKNETGYYSYMTVSSDIDRYVTSASHCVDVRNVLTTGNPRTDHYIRCKKTTVKTKTDSVKILYAPTFRDYELECDLFFPYLDFTLEKLSQFFSVNQNLKIYLRPHPSDAKSNIQAEALEQNFPNNIIYYSQQICDDIDEYMHIFDTVITDYSSIYIEPLLADIPCIFAPFDYNKYMQTRGLAYNYNLVTPGPKVNSFKEMLNSIEEAVLGAPEWNLHRNIACNMFFKYKDDGACERIAKEVFKSEKYRLKSN